MKYKVYEVKICALGHRNLLRFGNATHRPYTRHRKQIFGESPTKDMRQEGDPCRQHEELLYLPIERPSIKTRRYISFLDI
jgi:hypothetical protein